MFVGRGQVLWLRRANFLRRIFSNEANKALGPRARALDIPWVPGEHRPTWLVEWIPPPRIDHELIPWRAPRTLPFRGTPTPRPRSKFSAKGGLVDCMLFDRAPGLQVQALSATSSPAEAREAREAKVRVETKTLIQQLHQEEKQPISSFDAFVWTYFAILHFEFH